MFSKPQHYTATVTSKVQLTQNVWAVNFALKHPSEIQFVAGQTMMLHIAEGVNRAMSIASLPKDAKNLFMIHDVSPMGLGSKWTIHLKIGDTVSLMAPLGAFILDTQSHRKKVMIATGTGVVPFHSMIIDYLEHDGTDDITLYWGLRFEKDIYWQDEFEHLSQIYPNFHFILTLSKPSDAWQESASRRRGRVTDHVFAHKQQVPEFDFYLCGNQDMVKEVREKLFALNVPKEQIKIELFF